MKEKWIDCMGVKLLPALQCFVNAAKYGLVSLQGDNPRLITIEDLQVFKDKCDACPDLYFDVDSFEGTPLRLRFERANEHADAISSDINRVDVSQYDRIYGVGKGERVLDTVRGRHIMSVAENSKKRLFLKIAIP